MNDIIAQIKPLPTAQLQAIYNNAWRNQHNGIDPDTNNAVLAAIEFLCSLRRVEIVGRGGAWEFQGARDE